MHWFDPHRAIPEFARVLRPGGVFAPLANVVDDRVDWVAGYAVAAGGLPSHRNNSARRPVRHPGFSRFELAEFPHTQRRTAAGLVATVATHSDTLMRPADQRAAKLNRLAAYLRGRPETEGEFDLPLVTLAQRARLEPA
jgi:SAM-dependent methyltransferase